MMALLRLLARPRIYLSFGIYLVMLLLYLYFYFYIHRRGFDSSLHMLVLLCLYLGTAVGNETAEVLQGSFSWTLPGIRRQLSVSTLALSAGVSLPVVLLGALYGVPAFTLGSLAFLAFAFGDTVHQNTGLSLRFGLWFLVMMTIVLASDILLPVAFAHPLLTIPGALCLGTGLIFHRLRGARHRRILGGPSTSARTGAGRGRTFAPKGNWTVPLVKAPTRLWVRAARYEKFGLNPGRLILNLSWVWGIMVFNYLIVGLVALFFFDDFVGFRSAALQILNELHSGLFFLPVFAAIAVQFSSRGRIHLSRHLLYPIARRQRARIHYWGNLQATLILLALVGGSLSLMVLVLAQAAGVFPESELFLPFAPLLGSIAILHPFYLRFMPDYSKTPEELREAAVQGAFTSNVALGFLGLLVPWFALWYLFSHLWTPTAVGLGLVLFGLVQGYEWLRIQEYYRTQDLHPTSR